MAGAIDLLRGAAGNYPLIGCGIPLGTAWGRTEYCRVGADVAPYWQDPKFVHLHYRKRVATENGLTSALHALLVERALLPERPRCLHPPGAAPACCPRSA